jgi:SAM-dependent methyltransferase
MMCGNCAVLFQDPVFSLAATPINQREGEVTAQNPVGTSFLATRVYALYYGFTRDAVLRGARANGRRPRLLDVGCGAGQFLRVAASHFDVWGVDTSPEACTAARRHVGAERVLVGPFENSHPRSPFDVITMFQTIEHIEGSPSSLLATAFELLTPGGLLHIGEVPNLHSLEFDLFGDRCWYLSSPVHNYIFTERYFRRTLAQIGFVDVGITHDWKNYTISTQSVVHALHERTGRRIPVSLRQVFSALSHPLFLPVNAALAGLRRAVTFTVTARRPSS